MFHLLQLGGEFLEGWDVSPVWHPAHVSNCWADRESERRNGAYCSWCNVKRHGLRNQKDLSFNTASLWASFSKYTKEGSNSHLIGLFQLLIITKFRVFIGRRAKERIKILQGKVSSLIPIFIRLVAAMWMCLCSLNRHFWGIASHWKDTIRENIYWIHTYTMCSALFRTSYGRQGSLFSYWR